MNLAQQAWEVGHRSHVLDVLERYRPLPGEDDLRRFEWYYLWQLSQPEPRHYVPAHTSRINAVAFSPDGRTLASAGRDGSLILWETHRWQARLILSGHSRPILSAAFSPAGRLLA